MKDFAKISKALALVCAAAVGGAVVTLVGNKAVDALYTEKQEFRERAQDAVEARSLTVITLDKFRKDGKCQDENRPYSAAFVAKNAADVVQEGRVCISESREIRLQMKP